MTEAMPVRVESDDVTAKALQVSIVRWSNRSLGITMLPQNQGQGTSFSATFTQTCLSRSLQLFWDDQLPKEHCFALDASVPSNHTQLSLALACGLLYLF